MPPKQKSSRRDLVVCESCQSFLDENDLQTHIAQCLNSEAQTFETTKCGLVTGGQLFGYLNIIDSKNNNYRHISTSVNLANLFCWFLHARHTRISSAMWCVYPYSLLVVNLGRPDPCSYKQEILANRAQKVHLQPTQAIQSCTSIQFITEVAGSCPVSPRRLWTTSACVIT